MRRRRNIFKNNPVLSLLVIVAAVIAFFAATYFTMNYFELKWNGYLEVNGGGFYHEMPSVNYKGSTYRYRSRLDNILLLGVDSRGDIYDTDTPNRGQSDVMILVSIDHNRKEVNYIQINRDIMTNINRYNVAGELTGTTTAQICLAYAYGDGQELSCKNAVEAVSNLLYSVPIDDYYSVNIDGIAILNDEVGGVPVTIEDDFSGVDDTLVMGETVTLMGEHATNFIRTRREVGEGKNVDRMRRHRMYMSSFMDVFRKKLKEDPSIAVNMDEAVSEYRYTSMTAQEIARLLLDSEEYTVNDTIVLSGAENYDNRYVEVTPDDAEIRELVMNTFYEKAD